jgi:serine/threonine-protein kinase
VPDFTSSSWGAVSPYLDQALEMSEQERAAWLSSLREGDPELAARVQDMLNEHAELVREHYLEGSIQLSHDHAAIGQSIGAYTLVSPIGAGGMGSVWLATRSDGRFERQVAVKFLSLALAGREREARFQREGKILGRLAHPNIAELVDAGVSPAGQPYLVLEYVPGEHIDQYCEKRSLDVESRILLFLDVLSAVAHAHANLIIHRDIKPSNVIVRNDGQVKLLDFGIAKLVEDEERSGSATLLTREGGPLTPEYAAPEQFTNEPVTTATDVYALGVLLYLLLSLEHPVGPGPHSPASLVKAILENEPPRMSEVASRAAPDKLRRLLRGDLDTIVAKALKKNPQERYPSVTVLAEDLRRYLKHEPIGARPDALAYRAARFVRRNRTAVTLAGLALAAAIAGVVGTVTQAHRARLQRDFALRQLSRAEAINDLNTFLLSDAAPSGKPFTVNDLLERAEHIIQRQHVQDGARHVELLISIGSQYRYQDEDARARRVLDKAYELSRGLSERSTRSKASCALATTIAYAGELPRAEALVQEGLAELSDEASFGLDRVYCLLRGGEVARERGVPGEAIARVEAARRLLEQSPFKSELLELSAFMELAEAYRVAGRHRESSTAFESAFARLVSLGRDDTQQAGTLFNNWGLAVGRSGQPREAEKLFRRAIALSSSNQNEESVSPMVLVNYARTLYELGRFQEAADYAERGYARAKQSGDNVVIGQSLRLLSSIYRSRGDLTRAERMVSELEPWWRRMYPEGHIALAMLKSEQSVNMQARGDLHGAEKRANQAVTEVEASIKGGGEGTAYLPGILLRRSDLGVELHRPKKAEADARRALTMEQQGLPPGASSCDVGRAWLAVGRALRAQGKREDARSALESAAEHLHNTLGSEHPDTRIARQLASDLE